MSHESQPKNVLLINHKSPIQQKMLLISLGNFFLNECQSRN